MHFPNLFPALTGQRQDRDLPLGSLRREVDRLFEDFSNGPWRMPALFRGADAPMVPTMEVREDDKSLTVSSELPGVDEKDISVTISDQVLTIRGEKKEESERKEGEQVFTERSYGSFSRSMRLPCPVNEDKAEASFAKGVLTLTLPKQAEGKSAVRKISVKAA